MIVNAKIENAVIVTKSGEIYHCTGDLNSLESIEKLGNKLNGATVTHNHPENSVNDWTFSDVDLKLFKHFKLNRLRGIDEKYLYELNRNAENNDFTGLSLANLSKINMNKNEDYHVAMMLKDLIDNFGYRRWIR